MQKLIIGLAVGVLVVLAGCNQSPQGGGGKGTKEDTFTIKGPTMATAVKHGETKSVSLTLSRGKEFKEDVTFSTTEPPKGIKVAFEPATVKASEKAETEMKITAEKDAALGESTIVVNAKPAKGESTSLNVKVKVE